MSNWVFVVTSWKYEGKNYTAEQIFDLRIEDKFWGLAERTPNRKNLKKDDRVIFYMGLPHKQFVGTALLASDSYKLSDKDREKVGHGQDFYRSEYGVLLKDANIWEKPTPAESVIMALQFIDNKQYWYTYFQGGVREISDHDCDVIVGSRETSFIETLNGETDLESQSEFVLESQLEEFLDSNWDHISFGSELDRYSDEEQSGRQYPAGQWSIDFLCVDRNNNDFVVIELKRGKTSDATVGQVLRYIGWVKKNIAGRDQGVRGIIIAREVDDALKYAVSDQKNIKVLTYKLNFRLEPQ